MGRWHRLAFGVVLAAGACEEPEPTPPSEPPVTLPTIVTRTEITFEGSVVFGEERLLHSRERSGLVVRPARRDDGRERSGLVVRPARRDDGHWHVLALALAILGVIAIVRRARVTELAGEPISPLVAETVARSVQRANVVASAVSLPAVVWWASFDRTGALVLATLPIWFLAKVYLARSALRHLELGANAVERRSNWLYIASRLGRVYVGASSAMFAAAQPVPTSVARNSRAV